MTAITALQITRNNSRVARAAGMAMGADGVVIAQVARPYMACVFVLSGAFVALTVAKALLIASIGPEAYDASLAVMQGGGLADRAGAMLLGVDGATRTIAGLMM